jgi:amidase
LPFQKANRELDQPFFKSDAVYEPPCKLIPVVHKTSLTMGVDQAEVVEGMPTHVQVMGKPMQDEELMEILKVVESTLVERD